MAEPTHFVVDKFTQAKRLQSRKPQITALGEDFIDQENAGDRLVQFNEQTREDPKSRHRSSFHARSSQRETSSVVPDDISNRPFENRTNSPSGISAVGKLDIKGNARETLQDYSGQKGPRSPSQPFNGRKRGSESNPNRSPDQEMEPRTVHQSKAQIMNVQGAEEYWRGPAKPPGHSSLFDPDRGSPLTSSPTATRVYDPRSHIFRSKKAYESKPGVLPAPDSLHTRPMAGHKRVSSSLEFDSERYHDHQPPGGFLPYDSFNERDPSLLLQPETRPISQEQLVNEVKGIYAGLVMVEKKCVEIDNQQAQNQAEGRQIKLSHEQWQALIALHRTLLHEHHDFFLASQHPSASPALRKLAAKYAMPARMWRHGIHSFLELLRHRLPDSLDHMLAFIYLAYSMMALLKESVPAFEDTWIECLGDLARYRMAIEDEDLRDREVWSGVARYWYNKAADKSPRIGRIQHHLAVLARPNALQQLFYYTRALTCIQPFLNARESILTLFNPILEDHDAVIHRCLPIDIAFIKAHGILFKQGPLPTFDEHTAKFLSLLDNNIGRVTAKWREQGVWIASSNFFGILSCVGIDSTDTLFLTLSRILADNPTRSVELAQGIWISYGQDSNLPSSDSALVHASHLTFSALALALLRVGDKNVLPHVHVSLAFLLCVSLVPEVMRSIEQYVPWALLVAFLNTLAKPGVKFARVEAEKFPAPENGIGAYLPEDFSMRGQIWCQQYHPEGFFGEDCPVDDEERSLEMPSMAGSRVERCLYLGNRLSVVRAFQHIESPITDRSLRSFFVGLHTIKTLRHSLLLPLQSLWPNHAFCRGLNRLVHFFGQKSTNRGLPHSRWSSTRMFPCQTYPPNNLGMWMGRAGVPARPVPWFQGMPACPIPWFQGAIHSAGSGPRDLFARSGVLDVSASLWRLSLLLAVLVVFVHVPGLDRFVVLLLSTALLDGGRLMHRCEGSPIESVSRTPWWRIHTGLRIYTRLPSMLRVDPSRLDAHSISKSVHSSLLEFYSWFKKSSLDLRV